MIKNIPIEENPREKALKYGIETLNNVELLALILRTGNKSESVLQLSQRLLNEIGGFSQLIHMTYADLVSQKGIKEAKAIELLSIIEISKRLKNIPESRFQIHEPHDIYDFLKDEMMFLKQEHFLLLCLDTHNKILKKKTIFVGSLNMSIVTPREVFKEALSVSSAKIVICHNHPSGNSHPSPEDMMLTRSFVKLGEMMGIEVIDHIIIGYHEFYSILSQKQFYDEK